jgi:hypothetical protein
MVVESLFDRLVAPGARLQGMEVALTVLRQNCEKVREKGGNSSVFSMHFKIFSNSPTCDLIAVQMSNYLVVQCFGEVQQLRTSSTSQPAIRRETFVHIKK